MALYSITQLNKHLTVTVVEIVLSQNYYCEAEA